MLNEQDRTLVRRAWSQGPAALTEAGLSKDQIDAFLSRPDVQHEIALLDVEFKNARTLDARTKFSTKRTLGRLSDGAVATLARALAGPEYVRHPETGAILKDARGHYMVANAETTPVQLRAAQSVLDALGVTDPKLSLHLVGSDIEVHRLMDVAESEEELTYDDKYETNDDRALSRERMRNAIERLRERMPQLREGFDGAQDAEFREVPAATKKPKRKRVTKRKTKARKSRGKAT